MVTEQNDERAKLASQYIADLDAEKTLSEYRKMIDANPVDVVVGIITVQRNFRNHQMKYLTQVMAQLDRLFRVDTSFSQKVLFICNTHAGPGVHQEAIKLAQYFPLFSRFPNGSSSHVILDQFEKEKQDYAFCLKTALGYQPKYILLIEDDALPHPDMFGTVRYVLDHAVERLRNSGLQLDDQHKWAYLKLFYPEKWQGYAKEFELCLELLALGVLGGWVSLCAFLLCLSHTRRPHYSTTPQRLAFMLGACYMIFFAVLVGRQNLLEFRRLSYGLYRVKAAPQCCTPAVLYRSCVVSDLVDHLDRTKCTKRAPVDLVIDAYTVKHNFRNYVIEPNLFKHIGYISTLKGPARDPSFFI
ncbi:hypothetical protein LSH36_427g04025 [Paralvinella palmiformis]|uniref:Transmembrane protein 246 n=1 Tax=Paralvinella palmiformis TaxID=53620 RepID=A0AAD9MY19_9ANNE|nr:hypothetical protein LSH36_427g04025 [Paralvinella palmiformis]